MDLRSCLRKTLDQTGFVCVSDGRFFCNYAMLEKMEKMLLHRHHSFLRLGFHRRIHLLPISRSDKVTQGGYVFQYFHRQNPTIAVRARNKFLAEYEGKAEGKLQAKAFGLLRRKHIDYPAQRPLGIPGVQSGKNQVPCLSSAQSQRGRFRVSYFPTKITSGFSRNALLRPPEKLITS